MKRHTVIEFAVSVAFFFTFLSFTAFGQQATTSLSGTVSDASGALLPDATVSLTRGATGQGVETKTSARGQYRFQQLAPGTWTIKVSANGFGDQSKEAELLVSNPATVDFQMTVQAVSQTLDVSAQSTTLNTSDATLGNAVDNATIQALPMEDRNVPDLLSLQPASFTLAIMLMPPAIAGPVVSTVFVLIRAT